MKRKQSLVSVRLFVSLLTASTVINHLAGAAQSMGDGPPPPCPNIERLCDAPPPDGGDLIIEQECTCGPGEWFIRPTRPSLNPMLPIQGSSVTSEDWTTWRKEWSASATEGSVQAFVSVSGASSFGNAGSRTHTQVASYSSGWSELWRGKFPACPRTVMLAATGGGGLTIAAACAALQGCGASANATAAGTATSRGDASAMFSGLTIHGTVEFSGATHSTSIAGNFGGDVEFVAPTIEGSVSSESSWTTEGHGVATGGLSFTVSPDRVYCAITNLPIMARWTGVVTVATGVTVDDSGTAAGAAQATVSVTIN
ncbi:MAG: hypothetical protein EXS01_04970 [Phycisphaerales bacterium]|nr:hypothetical protein [Phycisphaerales bacterium]